MVAAAENGHTSTVKFLLDNGANINDKIKYDWTALMFASINGYYDTVTLLLDYGSDPNEYSTHERRVFLWGPWFKKMFEHKMTALMTAALGGHTEITQFLIDKGADINAKTNYGSIALILIGENRQT